MESESVLNAPELMAVYAEYNAALLDVDLAETLRQNKSKDAAKWEEAAAARVDAAASDLDALEINVYLASAMLADRYAIIERLRRQSPPVPWSKIGAILGMSRQAAHEWYGNYNLRPRAQNPTKPVSS